MFLLLRVAIGRCLFSSLSCSVWTSVTTSHRCKLYCNSCCYFKWHPWPLYAIRIASCPLSLCVACVKHSKTAQRRHDSGGEETEQKRICTQHWKSCTHVCISISIVHFVAVLIYNCVVGDYVLVPSLPAAVSVSNLLVICAVIAIHMANCTHIYKSIWSDGERALLFRNDFSAEMFSFIRESCQLFKFFATFSFLLFLLELTCLSSVSNDIEFRFVLHFIHTHVQWMPIEFEIQSVHLHLTTKFVCTTGKAPWIGSEWAGARAPFAKSQTKWISVNCDRKFWMDRFIYCPIN